MDLNKLYESICNTPSDINKHLPILVEYSKKCEHVTEMGARTGISTIAFIYANPKKFVSYDFQYTEPGEENVEAVDKLIQIFKEAQKQGYNCSYIGSDVLSVEIEQTDFLFIDTNHNYEQLKAELEMHSSKVNKYIAFHDTYTWGTVGEEPYGPNKSRIKTVRGILPAINEFLANNLNWHKVYDTTDNNGLIIIEKRH